MLLATSWRGTLRCVRWLESKRVLQRGDFQSTDCASVSTWYHLICMVFKWIYLFVIYYYFQSEFCSEFQLVDLRDLQLCLQATKGCDVVFNLAADMGGMGFIQSNHSGARFFLINVFLTYFFFFFLVILYNNIMLSFNVLEAARQNGVKRFFYSSSGVILNIG